MSEKRLPILEYYSAVIDSSRRWYRRHLTRESILDGLKTFVWVAPLTVFMWIYAEQQQEATESGQIAVSVHSADPNRIARLGPMADEWVLVDLKGPLSRIEAVKRQLSNATVPIEVPSTYPLGEVHVATESYVQNSPLFVNNGVKVQNVRPKTITVAVDTFTEMQIPVTVQDPSRLASAVFEPRFVSVRGPSETLRTAQRDGKLVAQADLSTNPEFWRPGLHEKLAVPIICPIESAAFVTVSPRQVQATVNVQQAAKDTTIDSVPVWVEGPPAFLAGVDVVSEPFVFKVKVSGPADQIQQIIDQKVLPHATLTVTSEDPLNVTRSKPLTFNNLPPDVKVSKADLEKPFDFKIKPKTPG